MNGILVLIALVWLGLALGVASHANGHNRRSLFWFTVTAVAGIFGVIVYLLVITSNGTKDPEDAVDIETEFAYVLASIGSVICALVVARVFLTGVRILTLPPVSAEGFRVSPLEPLFPLILVLSSIIGIVGGVLVLHHNGKNQLLYSLSYTPSIIVGIFAFPFVISVFGRTEGLFYGGGKILLAPLSLILSSILFAEIWRRAWGKMSPMLTDSDGSNPTGVPIEDRNRRRFLGAVGVSMVPLVGYGLIGENPDREEIERENEIITPDGVEVLNLSHGYSEQEQEYQIGGTVRNTSDEAMTQLVVQIDYYAGGGNSLLTSNLPLKFSIGAGDSDDFETTVEDNERRPLDPEDIERFVLEVTQR